MSTVLVIPDLHLPWCRKGSLNFVRKVQDKYKTNRTVFIGDICDSAAISFHQRVPEMPDAIHEYKLALQQVKQWYKEFPCAFVTSGNHDLRCCRVAASVGIPSMYLKAMNELYGTPQWKWVTQVDIDGVTFLHGDGFGGDYPWMNAARRLGQSCVLGHTHSRAGIGWLASQKHLYFGFGVGCLVDDAAMCFQYAHARQNRSILGCGVVKDGVPTWVPMEL
jgi:hypothetical protein